MPPLRIIALSLLLSPLGQAEEPPVHLGPITGIVTDGDHIYSVSQAGIFREAKRLAKPPFRVMSMAGALLGMGKRTKKINRAALKVARAIGPITHSESCDPFDVAKHLTSDYAKQKLGL